MDVNRSGYYKWKKRKENPSQRQLQRKEDLKLIKKIHEKHPSHGYRWINAYIRLKYGVIFTDSYIHRLCKYEGIRSKGKHYQWKKPEEEHYKFNNLIWNGWKNVSRPYEVIVSDMTQFYVKGSTYELTLYFDAWNKQIVGYGLGTRKGDTRSYYDGLKQVLERIKKEQPEDLITLHTDQGSVYSSKAYNDLITDFNIQRSMSRAGTPTDNPVNESLNGWIKEELFIDFNLGNSDDVKADIEKYIHYFNNFRPAYSLNYKTPLQFKIEMGF
jgi:transposase InsO family protein